MKFILAFLLAFSSFCCYSQNENILLKFCPLALVDDISFPTIQGGIEFRLARNITWYNEVGIKYRKSYIENTDTSFLRSSGYKLKTEIRYYFRHRSRSSFEGSYFASNVFFTKDIHNTQVEYFPNGDTTKKSTDVFGVKKNVLGLNIILGHQKFLSRNLILDLYAGIGLRFRNVHTIDQECDPGRDYIIQPIDLNIPAHRNKIDINGGNSVAPNLSLGLRVCYKLY